MVSGGHTIEDTTLFSYKQSNFGFRSSIFWALIEPLKENNLYENSGVFNHLGMYYICNYVLISFMFCYLAGKYF